MGTYFIFPLLSSLSSASRFARNVIRQDRKWVIYFWVNFRQSERCVTFGIQDECVFNLYCIPNLFKIKAYIVKIKL